MKIKIILIFALISLISCIEGGERKKQSDYKIINIVFPDTVSMNKNINGELKYDLKLDTIKSSELVKRYIFLYTSAEKISGGVDDIKKVEHNIFIDTLGEGIFSFKANFKRLGANHLTLILQDVIFVKSDNPDEAMLEIKDETTVVKNVFVKK